MSSTRSPAGTTIKIRAGGSGQSTMGTKAAATAPSSSASSSVQPAKIVLKTAAAATASSSSSSSSSSSGAAPSAASKPVVTLAARPSPVAAVAAGSSTPAVPSAAKAAPTKPTYTASSSSSSSSSAKPAASASSSTYENPSSYTAAGDVHAHTTPNGINLSLSSAESQAPNLLPPRTRSDRLRAAALAENREEVVALLGMPGGVDVNAEDTYGLTALMLAASRGAHEIVEELLELGGASVHQKDKYGMTAIHFACAAASYECVQLLLQRKAGVNVLTSKGQSALMKVAYISHPHSALIADLLCRHKAKPDLLSNDGASAASIAVQNDHLEIVQVLAHYGANVNLKTGAAPAAAAAAVGSASMAASAIAAPSSAAAASPSSGGQSLLHLAASRGSFTMIAHLVALGADPLATDAQGKTLLATVPPASGSSAASGSGSAAALSPKAFAARLQAAVDAGLGMRAEHARVVAENAAIIARLKAEKLQRLREEKIQAELQAAADAAVLAKANAASAAAATPIRPSFASGSSTSASSASGGGLLSPSRLAIESRVDSELGLQGGRVLYTDAEGVEHYSAPPSPSSSTRLTAQQLKERTYRPKLDPTSVFGDSTSSGVGVGLEAKQDDEAEQQEELGAGESVHAYDDDEPAISYHELLQARLHGTSSGAARSAPVAAPLQDEDEDEEQEEMKMVAGNSY